MKPEINCLEEPIRVAQVIGKVCGGGVESVIFNYYRRLDHTKIQFDFIIDEDSVCSIPQDILDSGARCFVVPPYQRIRKCISALKKLFKENKYKIVHSNMNTLSVFSLYAAKKAKVPIRICHSHSTASRGETKKNILKNLLRPFSKLYATDYFACSEYAGKWLFGKRTFKKHKITIINNAVDIEKYRYNIKIRENIRHELSLEDSFTIGHIGRFVFQKNHNFLIDIFNEVHKIDVSSKLVLIGGGPLENEIKEKVRALNLSDSVIFLGIKQNAFDYYSAMDVFALPSRYEGLPVVAVEAQVSALPVICSDGVTEETKNTDSFEFLSLKKGSKYWAERILNYKQFDRNLVDISQIESKFDINKQAHLLESIYIESYKRAMKK